MKFPVFDFHCDTALKLAGLENDPNVRLRQNDCHIDLARASALGGYAQCFACFTTPFMEKWAGISPQGLVFEKRAVQFPTPPFLIIKLR